MSDRRYYIEAWCDEITPCDCTLQGWADWLAKPDPEWRRDAAEADGAEFTAYTIDCLDDVRAVFQAGVWRFDPPPCEATRFYARFGEGLGWSADTESDTVDDVLALDEAPTEGQVEHIACVKDGPKVRLRFEIAGPRLIDLGPVQ